MKGLKQFKNTKIVKMKMKIPEIAKRILDDWADNRYEYLETEISDEADKDDVQSWIEELNEVLKFIGDEETSYEKIKSELVFQVA